MYFPTAGIECNPLLPFVVALGVSFVTSMGGVSGAFLLLPFQMSFLGYVNPSVSATNQFFNVLACPGGVWRYFREGRLIGALTCTMAIGTLPGVFAGAYIRINWLPDPGDFKIFAGLVLLYIGGKMFLDLGRKKKQGLNAGKADKAEQSFHNAQTASAQAAPLPDGDTARAACDHAGASAGASVGTDTSCQVVHWTSQSLAFRFQGQIFMVSTRKLALLSLVIGLVGGVYGIGGGAIMSPFLVSLFGLPVYAVAGATLFATFLTSVAGVSFYALLAPLYPGISVAPDWRLGLLLGLGGMAGMYLGARCQKHVPARALKYLLASILLFTALRYLSQGL